MRQCRPEWRRLAIGFREWIVRFRGSGVILLLLAQLAAAPALCNEPAAGLRIASEGARPPYNYFDGSELTGFEIELGRELCARMKRVCVFQAQDWDQMIPGLLANQYDAVMAALEITDERRETIIFSKPYVRMPAAFLASTREDISDTSPEGLKGKTIGVETGGPHQSFLDDVYKDSTIRAYASLEEAILDLAEGRIDVAFGARDSIGDFMKTRKEAQCCRLVAEAPRDAAHFGEGIGIGLRKTDAALKDAFDKAIDAVVGDGTFAKIRAKYFDFEIY
jgi:polar amino acid transport system substrate-binding protein